jgi:hypothetical protein
MTPHDEPFLRLQVFSIIRNEFLTFEVEKVEKLMKNHF